VLGNRRPAHTEIAGNLPDRVPPTAKDAQDFPAGRIGDRPEDSFMSLCFMCNHTVTNNRNQMVSNCQECCRNISILLRFGW
jgi:hypothetical protein